MKCLLTILLFTICNIVQAQKMVLTADSTLAIPKLDFDTNGELLITASTTSSKNDFDFFVGRWKMHNRKLKKRLENCKEWTAFESTVEDHNILNGTGNTDIYKATFDGQPFEGLTVRLFNPKTKLWSLYWVASNVGVMDPPVVGSFENNVGHFFCKDTFNGKKIIVVFRWDVRDKHKPIWGQAFSTDNGKTWEWNHFNVSERIR
jgi:hypothetical protein